MNLPVGMGQNFFGIMDRKVIIPNLLKEDSDFVELDEDYNIVDESIHWQMMQCIEKWWGYDSNYKLVLINDYENNKGDRLSILWFCIVFIWVSFLNYYVDNAELPKVDVAYMRRY